MPTAYELFKNLKFSPAAIGLEQREPGETYYCTPRDANIIGWAGVDGIHYCTIPEFNEMIFAVSPMNLGDCVHPIAKSFTDLLRMLLYCGDMAALEQCYAWDEEQFQAFLLDNPPTEQQRAVLDAIRKEFQLEPMEDAFAYVKNLQARFDVSQIPYTQDYYDPDMNAAAPIQARPWKVTYDGGFWNDEGSAGAELSVEKTFYWGIEKWNIPAVYLCDKGLVIDFLLEVDPEQVKAFLTRWSQAPKERQEQMEQENPLNVHFRGRVTMNDALLQNDHGCGLIWLPESCRLDGAHPDQEAQSILEHYGLDQNRAWAIHRQSYQWGKSNGLEPQSLSVHMERERTKVEGQYFITPAVGESVALSHPLTGKSFTLTVREVQRQVLPEHGLGDPCMEYPRHYLAMSYTLEPELPSRDFMVLDCGEGDKPRGKKFNPDDFAAVEVAGAAVIGIIGGADGPTAIVFGRQSATFHVACSSLHFAPVETVQWRLVFLEKMVEDITVQLL